MFTFPLCVCMCVCMHPVILVSTQHNNMHKSAPHTNLQEPQHCRHPYFFTLPPSALYISLLPCHCIYLVFGLLFWLKLLVTHLPFEKTKYGFTLDLTLICPLTLLILSSASVSLWLILVILQTYLFLSLKAPH